MFIKINDYELPNVARGIGFEYEQLVDSERNAQGVMVGQKVNRRLIKLSGLAFPYLTDDEWRLVLIEIEKFRGVLYYWDTRLHGFYEMDVYWGNASGTPEEIDEDGRVVAWRDCKCNIIDVGKPRTRIGS